jgi:uncharacterized protein
MKKHVLIAGGTGLIGHAIQKFAVMNGWECILLSRNAGPRTITWDPEKGIINLKSKMHFDAIINLAGASLNDGRWTNERKKEIYESRIKSCRTLENYLFDGRINTDVYAGASAVGIYGDRGTSKITEKTRVKPEDWFTKTVMDWETAHMRMEALEIRTLIFRFGLVLSEQGGALVEILNQTKYGVIPFFGSGKQSWPWIHIDDLSKMIFHCIDRPELDKIFLCTGPAPVSCKELIKTINSYLTNKRIPVGVPRIAMKMMLGEMHRVLFDSCNAIPERTLNSGFHFSYPTVGAAAQDLVSRFESSKQR